MLLLIMGIRYSMEHLKKARDAERKADLEKIRMAFEDYYNDNDCYPDIGSLEDCGSAELYPYLKEIPCDPLTRQPYVHFALRGNECLGYRILTNLERDTDPMIPRAGCSFDSGCGYTDGEGVLYDYGVAAGDEITGDYWSLHGGAYYASAWYLIFDGVHYDCNSYLFYAACDLCCYRSTDSLDHCSALEADCEADGCSAEAEPYVCDVSTPCE